MKSNLPQAFAASRAAKKKSKKMADGGKVGLDAPQEDKMKAFREGINGKPEPSPTPNPPKRYARGGIVEGENSKKNIRENSGKKGLGDSQWTGRASSDEASNDPQPRNVRPPVPQDNPMLHEDERDLLASSRPGHPGTQPKKAYDELDPMGSLPGARDMSNPHSASQIPRRMAHGGMVITEDEAHLLNSAHPDGHLGQPKAAYDEIDPMGSLPGRRDNERSHGGNLNNYAEGGLVDEQYGSVADAIMARRKRNLMMADGGEVSLEDNSREDLNYEDQMSARAGMKEQYDVDQISDQPEYSNEEGDEREKDKSDPHDKADAVRKRIKSKTK